ncbi:MAG: hypothetical protein JW809_13480 [Pirellulales bacterium]|nr:hypothetical protein [Pirellulales bacterium]
MRNPLFLRIVVPSLAISTVLLTFGIVSAWYVDQQQEEALQIESEGVERIRLAEKMTSGIRQITFYLNRFAIAGDRENLAAVQSAEATIWDNLEKAEELSSLDNGPDLLKQIRQGQIELSREVEKLRADSLTDSREAAQNLADIVATERILSPAQQFLNLSETALAHSGRRMQTVADHIGLSLLLLGVCGSVAGLVAGFAVARAVRMSILELYVPIRAAEGRLEEVVGPIQLGKPLDMDGIDSVLENLAGRIGTVVDRLQQSQLHLLRAEQLAAVGQLAAGLAHELRNPLMAMKILVQAAAENGETGNLQGRDLSVLAEEMTRLERSIQQFLDFARPPRLERHVFDVRVTLQQTLDLVGARAARQGVQLHKHVPDELLNVDADPEQVRQVLLNTILNSLDMLPGGGNVHVTLAIETPPARGRSGDDSAGSEEAARWVVIKIADDGPGIPTEMGQRIFDPFVSTKETGLGLGLAICRRIVEAHGGTIAAENTKNGGAEFVVRLPLEAQPEPAARTAEVR